jgi:hypothetical protein
MGRSSPIGSAMSTAAIVCGMVEKGTKPKASERDEPVALPLDPEAELRELPGVDPDAPVPQDEPSKNQGDPLSES